MPVLSRKLAEAGAEKLYFEIELPLCEVLAEMERAGFLVDRSALSDFGSSLTESIERLQKSIWDLAGHEFNINSPKQLGEVRFEELMLPAGKKTKTGWSTNAEILEKDVYKRQGQAVYVSATPGEYERERSGQIAEQISRPTGLLDPEISVRPVEGQDVYKRQT